MSIVRHRLTIVWPGTGWLRESPTFLGEGLDVKARANTRKTSQVDLLSESANTLQIDEQSAE